MKRVLVTGGNKGIGLAICRRLLEEHPDVFVILGSRDVGRGEEAVRSLSPISQDRIELAILDTSDDNSVRAAAQSICGSSSDDSSSSSSLYGIVNNAGIGFGKGYRDTINTNYFGPRRVCDAFLPFVTDRVVNIASASGPNFVSGCQNKELQQKLSQPALGFREGGIDELDALATSYLPQTDYGNEAYGVSKALLNAYTVLLAQERQQQHDVLVNSCSPGYILTDMTKGMGASSPPEKGAVCPVHLLMSDDVKHLPPGRYYGSDKLRSPLGFYRGPGEPPYEGP